MKKKTFLIATLLSIALPVVFVITSCTNTNNRIHVILSNKTLSINDDTIACVFIGTSSKDVITCNSVYHPTYLDIGEYNPSLKALFIHKTNLAVNETIQTPLSFYNHGKLFETINIDILADGASLDYSQYINERTMSLAYLYQDGSDTMISRGTGWIINKKNSVNPYDYWLATNFHVIANLASSPPAFSTLYYASTPDELNTQIPFQPATVGVQLGSYYPLANYTIIDQRYSQSTTVNADGIDGNPGNDMVVIDCNFGNNPNSSVCAKLDKLNDEWSNSGAVGQRYINNFIDWNTYANNSRFYWGGYPAANCANAPLNNNAYAEWQFDWIDSSIKIDGGDAAQQYWHPITSTSFNNIVDVAPQIRSNDNKINSKLGGGASGSMVIDQDEKIVGIYWGGWGSGAAFYPFYDIFNNSNFTYLGTSDYFLNNYIFS